jgi:hypothetical protein
MKSNKKQSPEKQWIKIIESIVENADLKSDLEKICTKHLATNIEKLKDENDLEKKVYQQYKKNKKLPKKLQKEYLVAILTEQIVTVEKDMSSIILKYVIDQRLIKNTLNETLLAFALVACLFTFCQSFIDSLGKKRFIEVVINAFNWHSENRKNDCVEGLDDFNFNKLIDVVGAENLSNELKYRQQIHDVSETLTTKKEDLN